MIDRVARQRAITVLEEIRDHAVPSDNFEERWPAKTKDVAVRSIGFWLWTLYSDTEVSQIDIQDGSIDRTILENSLRFLRSDRELSVKDRPLAMLKTILFAGVEWVGCELPWHPGWPFNVEDMESDDKRDPSTTV